MDQARSWANELAAFDWRSLQDELNALPQFTSDIDGESIHFVHVRSTRDDAIPLLLLHGWLGTVVDLIVLIAPPTTPEAPEEPACHVVIP